MEESRSAGASSRATGVGGALALLGKPLGRGRLLAARCPLSAAQGTSIFCFQRRAGGTFGRQPSRASAAKKVREQPAPPGSGDTAGRLPEPRSSFDNRPKAIRERPKSGRPAFNEEAGTFT